MSKRAEEAALKAYPVCIGEYSDSCDEYDTNEVDRITYIEGYEQAEKDTIERAVELLKEKFWTGGYYGLLVIEDFRKAMEEE